MIRKYLRGEHLLLNALVMVGANPHHGGVLQTFRISSSVGFPLESFWGGTSAFLTRHLPAIKEGACFFVSANAILELQSGSLTSMP